MPSRPHKRAPAAAPGRRARSRSPGLRLVISRGAGPGPRGPIGMARRWRACCIVVVVCLVTVGAGVAVPSAAPRAHAANGKARDVHPPASAKRARHAEVPRGDFSRAHPGRPGKLKGKALRYPAGLAHVDLADRMHDATLKQTIWLNAPPSAGSPTTFSFPLTLVGLRAQADAHGGVAIYDASGTRILSLPNGVATDSSGDVAQGNTA